MRTIEVQAPGLLTTVQDLGREGFGSAGISASGAADPIALRLGNRLVGNSEGAAGLEMTLLGGTFRFPEGGVVALAGSDFGATLDGMPVERWASIKVKPGQTFVLGHTREGARCTLCVQGGVAVKPFLGSASTHVLSGLGGLDGRALRKGDVLEIGPPLEESRGISFLEGRISPKALQLLAPGKMFRVTAGPQSSWFPKTSQSLFYGSAFCVTEECDRMGIRLAGTNLPAPVGKKMVTEGVSLGAIQVPQGGAPIILFVEQQTTGGYPILANVISADLSSLGQLRPRDEIRFKNVDMKTAHTLLREQEALLASTELVRA